MQKAVVTVLLPDDARNNSARHGRADKFLHGLANAGGGELWLTEAGADLKEVFARIAEELRLQYTLCYYPRNQSRDGTLRRIRVEVGCPGVRIHAHTGYRAAAR